MTGEEFTILICLIIVMYVVWDMKNDKNNKMA